MSTFVHRSRIEAPAEDVFFWHERPGAFARLNPPWEKLRVLAQDAGIQDGSRVTLLTQTGLIRQRWVVEHRDYIAGRQFRDIQIEGPFAHWNHMHRIESDGDSACWLEDRVEYELPSAVLTDPLAGGMIRRRLERMFAYRHAIIAADMAAHRQFLDRGALKILISGSTGMLGTALIPLLTTGGHRVVRLVRRPRPGEDVIFWNPAEKKLDPAALEDFDAFIHLSGEYIADGRWTRAKRERVWNSRVETTKLLVQAIRQLKKPPKALVCASGSGYYGEGGDRILDEDAPHGHPCFFVDMVRAWESAAQEATAYGVRVVNARIGIVLSPVGGALKSMLPAFKWGAGAVLGSGCESTGWLTLDDLIGMMHFAVMCETLHGPVNFVSPLPITQRELSREIGRILHRPVLFRVPNYLIKLILGQEMAEAMGWSQRLVPSRLNQAGYHFRHPDLEDGLRHVLGLGYSDSSRN
jgi:uncharacterized protein